MRTTFIKFLLAYFYIKTVFDVLVLRARAILTRKDPQEKKVSSVSCFERLTNLGSRIIGGIIRRLGQTRKYAPKIFRTHSLIRQRAALLLSDHIQNSPNSDFYLKHYNQKIAGGKISCEEMVGLIPTYAKTGKPQMALELAGRLTREYPTNIIAHQNAAVQCFLQGDYLLAEKLWTDSADIKHRLQIEKNLAQFDWRLLGPSWFLAVGHIAHLDTYFKLNILQGKSGQRGVPVIPSHLQVPNEYLLGLWEPFFVPKPERQGLLPRLDLDTVAILQDEFWCSRFGFKDTRMFSHAGSRVQQEWHEKKMPPLISIPAQDVEKGRAVLEALGVPRDAWFVCLHVRESGFHKKWHEKHPGTRNADPITYVSAIKAIVERGGYVVRMGDSSMTSMPSLKGFIDYAKSEQKSDFMDIFLCSACRFFIGTNSGLGLVPPLFGVPCVLTNWSPIALPQWYPRDIFIPKMIFHKKTQKPMKFQELYQTAAGWQQFESYFRENDLEIRENTEEELRDVTLEMMEREFGLGENLYLPEDITLQEAFNRIVADNGGYAGSRMGRDFLRAHSGLL